MSEEKKDSALLAETGGAEAALIAKAEQGLEAAEAQGMGAAKAGLTQGKRVLETAQAQEEGVADAGQSQELSATSDAQAQDPKAGGWLSWFCAVFGWLFCAFECLWLWIELEAWPAAYEVFFPAILLILFCNVLVFIFIGARFGARSMRVGLAVMRVCLGEGLLLGLIYLCARLMG